MWAVDLIYGAGASTAAAGFCEDDALLACEDTYRRRYRHWRGRSGRTYVFSVYDPADCPPYENAVLVVSGPSGALACVDLGGSPEARLQGLRRVFADRLFEVEFQIHVLAERAVDRLFLIEDLALHAA